MERGIVFNIQRYTIHDGPGIRTELFLKGCPLKCRWCSNPESHKAYRQPGVYQTKCIGEETCGSCRTVCERADCLNFQDGHLVSIDREACTNCMKCTESCPADAIKQWGMELSVEEAMETIRKDRSYYESSGGGVTLSGGEPLVQDRFSAALLRACKEEGIHTCMETTLYADWKVIEEMLPVTDLFIADLKHMDSEAHKIYIGAPNEKILSNLERLSGTGKPIILRIPVIPGVNDSPDNIRASADFILEKLHNRIERLQLLEFMRLGEEKYQSLGMPYPMKDLDVDKDAFTEKVKKMAEYFNSQGIRCTAGTATKARR